METDHLICCAGTFQFLPFFDLNLQTRFTVAPPWKPESSHFFVRATAVHVDDPPDPGHFVVAASAVAHPAIVYEVSPSRDSSSTLTVVRDPPAGFTQYYGLASVGRRIVSSGWLASFIAVHDALSGEKIANHVFERAGRSSQGRQENSREVLPDFVDVLACFGDESPDHARWNREEVFVGGTAPYLLSVDLEKGQTVQTYRGDHSGQVWGITACFGRNTVLTASWDSKCRIFDHKTGEQVALIDLQEQANTCCFSQEYQTVVLGLASGEIATWDLRQIRKGGGNCLHKFQTERNGLFSMDQVDERRFAAASVDCYVCLLDAISGEVLRQEPILTSDRSARHTTADGICVVGRNPLGLSSVDRLLENERIEFLLSNDFGAVRFICELHVGGRGDSMFGVFRSFTEN